jgi:hypothetical protein
MATCTPQPRSPPPLQPHPPTRAPGMVKPSWRGVLRVSTAEGAAAAGADAAGAAVACATTGRDVRPRLAPRATDGRGGAAPVQQHREVGAAPATQPTAAGMSVCRGRQAAAAGKVREGFGAARAHRCVTRAAVCPTPAPPPSPGKQLSQPAHSPARWPAARPPDRVGREDAASAIEGAVSECRAGVSNVLLQLQAGDGGGAVVNGDANAVWLVCGRSSGLVQVKWADTAPPHTVLSHTPSHANAFGHHVNAGRRHLRPRGQPNESRCGHATCSTRLRRFC